jgi:hypothetical protein
MKNHTTSLNGSDGRVLTASTGLVPADLLMSGGPGSQPDSLKQTLYLTEEGDTQAISIRDIHQGQMDDCFLLASIGEIALRRPAFISHMIHACSNGSETVTLYEDSDGQPPTWAANSFRAVHETVSNVFPNYSVNDGATQDVVAGRKEIWPQVLEKAVAVLNGGYSAIANGGSPLTAMEELTGHAASFMAPASLTFAALRNYVKAADLIVMDTPSVGVLPDNLVNNHAYMFEGVTGGGASAKVHLGNPWGFDQPAPMSLSQLSHGFAIVEIGHLS